MSFLVKISLFLHLGQICSSQNRPHTKKYILHSKHQPLAIWTLPDSQLPPSKKHSNNLFHNSLCTNPRRLHCNVKLHNFQRDASKEKHFSQTPKTFAPHEPRKRYTDDDGSRQTQHQKVAPLWRKTEGDISHAHTFSAGKHACTRCQMGVTHTGKMSERSDVIARMTDL